jgi:hypothetical protein
VALIIGQQDYTGGWPRLDNNVSEYLRQVREGLEHQDFRVKVVSNPKSNEMRQEILSFLYQNGFDPDSSKRLLMYYFGHGESIGPQGFIVPTDAPPAFIGEGRDRPNPEFRASAMSFDEIDLVARLMTVQHARFVFDSCFSGQIFQTLGSPHLADDPRYVTRKENQEPARQYLTSGPADEQVPNDGRFKDAFLRLLSGDGDFNGDGYVTGKEIGASLENAYEDYKLTIMPHYGTVRDPRLNKGNIVLGRSNSSKPELANVYRGPYTSFMRDPRGKKVWYEFNNTDGNLLWKFNEEAEVWFNDHGIKKMYYLLHDRGRPFMAVRLPLERGHFYTKSLQEEWKEDVVVRPFRRNSVTR